MTHVLRIRVCAPMDVRVKRMVERIDAWGENAARAEIRRSDAAHEQVLRKLFGVKDWENSRHYHQVYDTGRQSADDCTEELIALTGCPEFQPSSESRAKLRQLVRDSHSTAAANATAVNATFYSSSGM